MPNGGIAAAAAAAAAARSKQKREETDEMPPGGIAAAAAGAAAARSKQKREQSDEMPSGGIAAAAAAAALTRNKNTSSEPMPNGGIAAAAAAAAAARSKQKREETGKMPSGGVTAAAAAALLAKSKQRNIESDDRGMEVAGISARSNETSEEMVNAPSGGIAAAQSFEERGVVPSGGIAVAEALNRNENTQSEGMRGGGIAAAAAAAAMAKRYNAENDVVPSGDIVEVDTAVAKSNLMSERSDEMPSGGIAAAAAAAARSKQRKEQTVDLPSGGVAAAAAAAARSKQKNALENVIPPGGIAAAAAAAERSKRRSEGNGGMPSGGIVAAAAMSKLRGEGKNDAPSGGIAAAAAAAARDRRGTGESAVIPSGGIAAAAAAAAAARSKQRSKESNNSAAGGIAAAAAAAARSKRSNEESDVVSSSGGIAAAAAALAKNKNTHNESTSGGELSAEEAAAAARAERNDEESDVCPSGGIAAVAAAAARSKQKSEHAPSGGIAAAAAAAARSKQKIAEKDDVPSGGIAAAAAAAALARNKNSHTPDGGMRDAATAKAKQQSDDRVDAPSGGVAAAAAAAAMTKRKNAESDSVPTESFASLSTTATLDGNESPLGDGMPSGGIAAAAAAAALAKDNKTQCNPKIEDIEAMKETGATGKRKTTKQINEPTGSIPTAAAAKALAKRRHFRSRDEQSGIPMASSKIYRSRSEGSCGMSSNALLQYSSLSNLSFDTPDDDNYSYIDMREHPPSCQFMAYARWRQMVAKWKHCEAINVMTSRPTSHHFIKQQYIGTEHIHDGSHSSRKRRRMQSVRDNVGFDLMRVTAPSPRSVLSSDSNNLSGFSPAEQINDPDLPILSPYLTSLGVAPRCCVKRRRKCHACRENASSSGKHHGKNKQLPNARYSHCWEHLTDISESSNILTPIKQHIHRKGKSKDSPSSPLINDLINSAQKSFKRFRLQVEKIAAFAAQNSSSTATSSSSPRRPVYSVNIKSKDAIRRKATMKYDGDILQVKDILRAQFILSDEGSLICALVALQRFCSDFNVDDNVTCAAMKMKIVRVKNLFRMTPTGTIVPSNLPTSYRHILVNVRLQNGLLAEFQFQLAPMFNLFGSEGYSLHRDLVKLEFDCWHRSMASSNDNTCEGCEKNPSEIHILPTTKGRNSLLICQCAELNAIGNDEDAFDSFLRTMMANSFDSHYEDSTCNKHQMIDLMITSALYDVQRQPRDIANYMCLQEILQTRYLLGKHDANREQAIEALERGLAIADQAGATGMMGWLEYGSSSPLDRTAERSLDILANLAAYHVVLGDWKAATDVLTTLVLRCEQHLPLYHPLTLVSMLDLAATLLNTRKDVQAGRLVQRVNQRLFMYLGEQEQQYHIFRQEASLSFDTTPHKVNYQKQNSLDHLAMLQAFAIKMRRLLRRKMTRILGNNHPMNLLFQCYVADSLAVLANCLDSTNNGTECQKIMGAQAGSSGDFNVLYSETHHIWALAAEYYRMALDGWISIHGIHHSNVPSTSCGLARCLRELGKRKEAIEILSFAVGPWRGSSPLQKDYKKIGREGKMQKANSRPMVLCYKPPKFGNNNPKISSRVNLATEQALALCLWWMAVYFVEDFPDERGRVRALSLLHACSEALQAALEKSSHIDNAEAAQCAEMLAIVEQEAKQLFSFEINNEDNNGTPERKNCRSDPSNVEQRIREQLAISSPIHISFAKDKEETIV